MAKPTVYGIPQSTYVRTVRLLLEEAGAEYDLKPVDIFSGETKSPEYLAKHPFGKVPTVEIDGETIYETVAITPYLNTVFAGDKFIPSEPLHQARMRQIMAIIDSYLYAPAIRSIFIQRVLVPSQGGQTDEEMVAGAIAPAQTAMQSIESLAVCEPYLLGNELTLADFHLIPIFVYFSATPEFETATAQTPKLQKWWSEVSQLPSVKKVCA